MENQNTQTVQTQAGPDSDSNVTSQNFPDGGLIVVMTDSFSVTGGTDEDHGATGTATA